MSSFIKTTFAKSNGEIFSNVLNKDALIYTNSNKNIIIGSSNSSFIALNSNGTLTTSNINATGTIVGSLNGSNITGVITNAQIDASRITGTIMASTVSSAVSTSLGGTGVTTGLTVLNANNVTSGILSTTQGGTGTTTITGSGLNVLNSNPTFATLSNLGVLSNAGIMYTNQLSNFGGIDASGQTIRAQTFVGSLGGANITGTITNAQIDIGKITGTITASTLSSALASNLGGTGVTTGLTQLNATNVTTGVLAVAQGGTGVANGLTQLNATNFTTGTFSSNFGGTGVTTGLTVLNATNVTSGILSATLGGTGTTTTTGSGLNVLNSNPTFATLSNLGVLSNSGLVYTNQLSNFGGIDASGQTIRAQTFIGSLGGANITGTITNAQIDIGKITGTITASTLSSALATNLGGTGVLTGLTQLNATNVTTGTLAVAQGGTGATQIIGSGSNVLNSNPTFNSIANIGVLSNTGIVYTNQLSNWGGIISTGTITAPTFSGNATSATTASLCSNANNMTGTLAVSQGGTGATIKIGTGLNVLNSNPTFNILSNIGVLSNSGIMCTNQLSNYAGIDVVSGNIINRNSTSSSTLIGTTVNNTALQGCTVINSSASDILNLYANNACLRMMGIMSDLQTNGLNKVGDCAIMSSTGTISSVAADTGGLTLGPWAPSGVAKGIRIDGPTGNVGIGLSNPAYPLDVLGNINCTGVVSANNIGLFRNRIINGDMRINQRGNATITIPANNTTYFYLVDRFMIQSVSHPNVIVATQTQANLANFATMLTVTNNTGTAFASTGNGSLMINQILEANTIPEWYCGSTKSFVFSFWARSSINASYSAGILSYIASGRSATYYQSFTLVANTWKYIKIVIPSITSLGAQFFGTDRQIICSITLGAASTTLLNSTTNVWDLGINATYGISGQAYAFTSTAGATFSTTGWQFEVGSIATPFEYRPFGTELQLCQRYYCTSYPYGAVAGTYTINYASCATAASGNLAAWQITYPVSVRPGYKMSIYAANTGTLGSYNVAGNSTNYSVVSVSSNLTTGSFIYANNAADNNFCYLFWVADGEYYI